MPRQPLIPKDVAFDVFERAFDLGEDVNAEVVMGEFERINSEVTWSQVRRWMRTWEDVTGKQLKLVAPASEEAEAPVGEELDKLAKPARKARKPRRVSTPETNGMSGDWEIKTWETSDGTKYAFPVPVYWLNYVRDLLRVAGEAL